MLTNMKTIYKKISLLCIAAVGMMIVSSCTKEFKSFNTDPSKVTQAQAAGDFQFIGSLFPDMEQNIVSDVDYIYQYQQSLNADAFSGYEMSADPGFGPCNYNYNMLTGWNQQTFDSGFQHAMADWREIKLNARPQDQHFVAMALILKVEAMHRITDVYGPLPYTHFGLNSLYIPYDSQQAIYTQFFNELDTAENVLTAYVKANSPNLFKPFDLVYGGDYKQWLKFANTLRLRLAMRLAYVDAATAKLQAEKAVADPNGLLSTVGDDALLNMVNGVTYQNSLWNITNAYGDISMGASMESIMDGYNDPREGAYFLPSTAGAGTGTYKGIRIGVTPNGAQYATFSLLNVKSTTPMQIMLASESYFLRAEGALRGWNMGGGTAQSFYEAGITLSFQEKGVTMPTGYLTNNTNVAAAYVDPTNAANNSSGLNNITIAWDPAATFEQSLQRIITQKWIAIYPDGEEAWAEVRRTGYPKIFNVIPADNESGGIIKPGAFPERLPFAADEDQNNPKGVAEGTQLLGGPDNAATKLWWDTNPNGE
jgi:hypothetical protein